VKRHLLAVLSTNTIFKQILIFVVSKRKVLGEVGHICNPRTQEAEAGGSLIQG
jgi:hypothetical protein